LIPPGRSRRFSLFTGRWFQGTPEPKMFLKGYFSTTGEMLVGIKALPLPQLVCTGEPFSGEATKEVLIGYDRIRRL